MQTTTERQRTRESTPRDLNSLLHNLSLAEQEWKAAEFPVALKRTEIRKAIRNNTVFLEAETGSGKSTIAPVLILHELLQDNPDATVAITQPRRLATESIARFVGEKIGAEYVDYRFRGHPITKPNAPLHFIVEQSLLNELQEDELLTKYDAVIWDECHESTITQYMTLPGLKRAQALRKERGKRPLKIILASGSLDETKLASFFPQALHEHVEGRTYPVTPHFSSHEIPIEEIPQEAVKKAQTLLLDPTKTGDILIFMPGRAEIEEVKRGLGNNTLVEVVTIMGGDQDGDPYKKIARNPGNKRRVYIATKAAQTSITIPKITIVIDSGLSRNMIYDPITQLTTLETLPHTQADWIQRIGRAGRTQAGEAYALFTKEQLEKREKQEKAEFLRSDLTPQILKMKAIGIQDVYTFDYIEHPEKIVIDRAVNALQYLGALDKSGNITPLGKEMAEIDEDPHFARMLIEAQKRDCLNAVTLLIGFMKSKNNPFSFNPKKENFQSKYAEYIDPQSDFITYLRVWNDFLKNRSSREYMVSWLSKGFRQEVLLEANKERGDLLQDVSLNDTRIDPSAPIDLSPEKTEAINLSIASGIADKLLVKEPDERYKFASADFSSRIQMDTTSGVGASLPKEVLSGKIRSSKKKTTATFSTMNLLCDQEKLLETFDYLRHAHTSAEVTKETTEEEKKEDLISKTTSQEAHLMKELKDLEKKEEYHEIPPIEPEEKTFFQKITEGLRRFTTNIKTSLYSFWKRIGKLFGG